MSEPTTRKNKLDLAYAALLSEDDTQVLDALSRIERAGDARAIPHLLNALVATESEAVRTRITDLLFQVKAAHAAEELLSALTRDELRSVRRTIVATFWNAGLDVRDHLDAFITIAVEGSAAECFESLTVIEHQELWPEKDARKGLARVRKAAAAEADAYKAAMLNDLVGVLEERLGVA